METEIQREGSELKKKMGRKEGINEGEAAIFILEW